MLLSCASPNPVEPKIDVAPPDAATPADASEPSYFGNAAALFQEAELRFDLRDYARADALYRDLVKRFAYSQYAKKAELRIADIEKLRLDASH
jgi:outer membrane protein assembly factor BamD (BamD/ComL family)